MITTEEIQKLADLARIELTDAEKADLAGDIGSILQYVDQIKAASGTSGDSRPKDPVRNVMRADANPHESGAHTQALVAEFPKKDSGSNTLKVKKIL